MLVLGGGELQEIFYNLPGENVAPERSNDIFEVAISKLDEYFLPKQNKTFERHIFRLIILNKTKVNVLKNFEKPDDHIIYQVLEKSLSTELRKNMLTMGDDITLDQVITVRQLRANGEEKDERSKCSRNQDTQYIFNVKDDATIECEIGGVNLEMLIDSGCT